MAIYFHVEDIKFRLREKKKVRQWIKSCIKNENCQVRDINYIFTSDTYLRTINKKFLKRDYYTDTITFNYSNKCNIEGDIYISIETVKKNSVTYKSLFCNELYRVMIHGILHLVGYDDKNEKGKRKMRELEDFYLKMVNYLI